MGVSVEEPRVVVGRTGPGARSPLRGIFDSHEVLLLSIILAAGTVLSFVSPGFLTWGNIHAVFLGLSVEAIVAIGMTMLLVSGGFDLSVGSTMALTGVLTAMALTGGVPVALCIPIGLAVGATIGLSNGLTIAHVRINPFITTLGTMGIARGLVYVLIGEKTITGLPSSFKFIGQQPVLGIQLPIILSLVLVLAFDLLLRKSKFLRQNYYIGGNEKAAFLCGIAVNRMKVFNYALTGLLAAAAGIANLARFGSTSVTAGVGLELKVITAVVIGGASLTGGEGTILGAFLGALLMAIIADALTLLGVNPYWNNVVTGSALLVAVLIDTLNKRRKGLL
jgi:ribose transport system permease protein